MKKKVLLITPPFTQLNTPYPATVYLKGFLNTKKISSFQADLGIDVLIEILSSSGLSQAFSEIMKKGTAQSENSRRIVALQADYIRTITPVIAFLQGKNPTLAHRITQGNYLPEAGRFKETADLEWAFGLSGIADKAKHIATLYLEDLSDLIQECLDPYFGFSRYAERLGRSAYTFESLENALNMPPTFTDTFTLKRLSEIIKSCNPDIVGFSVPFPGNLYSAFRCAQWIKENYPQAITVMGGGFPNTELRSVSDPKVFQYFDFIPLDDGEAPIEHLLQYQLGERPKANLKRTFGLENGQVFYFNGSTDPDYKQSEIGTPDYSDLKLDSYISVLETANPMHRLWSDGRWNKLTMAHGCYWGKCTFCDISLDYIRLYEPITARLLCDRMENLMKETGETGFHFVDEAAPPALMRALALEILNRGLAVTWWTNIRFEKSFTKDLCQLLRASGCIAVSGGLEVASDRLLALIKKGVTVEQVAQVTRNFTESDIMVHAYLMYGFPTQTDQETIDSLEMVRQMFEEGVLQSGFWHQFALTAHSPIGLYPENFQVVPDYPQVVTFACNDLEYKEKSGTIHEKYSFGLKKSLYNFMHGIGLDTPLQDWFEFRTPKTSIPKNYISNSLNKFPFIEMQPSTKIVWLGGNPAEETASKEKKSKTTANTTLRFHTQKENFSLAFSPEQAKWLQEIILMIHPSAPSPLPYQKLKNHYEAAGLSQFELFWYSKPMEKLKEKGLLLCL